MKNICCLLLATLLLDYAACADIVTQWDFNSNPPDGVTSTGTNVPSIGAGTASLVSCNATYASGSSADTGADNSAWNLAMVPPQGQSNKLVGVQFRVSTIGYEDIVVTWQQQNSGNSSKYTRFQYSIDGTTFLDGPVITATVVGSFVPQSVSLGAVGGVNNNANFAIRLVAEFESTAVGGADVYMPSTSTATYGSSGRVRCDLMTISGSPPSGNTPPTISAITNQTTRANTSIDNIPFVIGDGETPADNLLLVGDSSNTELIPTSGIIFGGSGSNRTVSLSPNFDVSGTTTITIVVLDEGSKSNATSFVVTVLPENTPPIISSFTNYHTLINTSLGPIPFTASDAESDPDSLIIDVYSSNAEIIPPTNVMLAGTGTNRSLTITPAPSTSGDSVITVTATDGFLITSNYFNVMVLPSPGAVLIEPFNYPDGTFTTNSGGLWTTHSGTIRQTQLTGGKLELRANLTEDVNARLIGAPYAPAGGAKLFAAMRVSFSAVPGNPGEYFAHFRDLAGNFRARVYGSTTNASPGMFRFGLANNSSAVGNIVFHTAEFGLFEERIIVVMYDVGQSISKLWVDPKSENDAALIATDNPNAAAIGSIAFRQNTGIGTLAIDNLRVALSFDDAVGVVRLGIVRNGLNLEISWPTAATTEGYLVESTIALSTPDWRRVTQSITSSNGRDTLVITSPAGDAFYRLRK